MWRWIGLMSLPLLLAACANQQAAPVTERGAPPAAVPAVKPVAGGAGFYTVKKGDTLYSIALDHGRDYKDVAAWNNLENPHLIKIGQQLRVSPPEAAAVVTAKPVNMGTVEGRPLDAAAKPASNNTDTLKREPRGGVLPYSDRALAQVQALSGAAAVDSSAGKPAGETTEKPADKPATDKAAPAPVPAAGGEDAVDWVWPASGKVIASYVESASGGESNKGVDLAGKTGDPVLAAGAGKVVYVGSSLRGYGNLVIVRHNARYLSAYAHNSRILVKEGQAVGKGQKIAEIGSSDTDRPKLHFEIRQQGKPVDPLKFLPAR